jgi:hypothetical protein
MSGSRSVTRPAPDIRRSHARPGELLGRKLDEYCARAGPANLDDPDIFVEADQPPAEPVEDLVVADNFVVAIEPLT